MKSLRTGFFGALLMVLAASSADAAPLLQLDIIGGHYDPTTQTVISEGPDFTLVALLTPKANQSLTDLLNDTYYISAAVTPNTGPNHSALGSFTWNGANHLVTEDMVFGTPPLEEGLAEWDPGDLAGHEIFPSFFSEFSFQFSPANRTVSYDSADHRGGPMPTTATTNISYFATFNITTALVGANELHFDLYSSLIVKCRQAPSCAMDEDAEYWAPFRNDAESSHSVAEPQSMAMLSFGLLLAGRLLRRRPTTT